MKHQLLQVRPRLGVLVALALVLVALPLAATAGASDHDALEADAVVEVILADKAALDRLVDSGADLTHDVDVRADGSIVAQAVVTDSELAELRDAGYTIGKTLWTEADSTAVLAERAAIIARKKQASRTALSRSFLADTDRLTVLRVDYFTSGTTGQFLSVEVKSDQGSTTSSSPTITVEWDSGPGTELGSGGSLPLQRFTDAGFYIYNYRQFSVAQRPSYVRFTSSAGGSAVAPVTDWLPIDDKSGKRKDPYFTDFVDHYLTPQELYARIENIHERYPGLTELIELPYKTNGYQRKAMASMCGTVAIGSAPNAGCGNTAAAVYLETHEWGHLGGNDVWAEFVDPGAADQPLSVVTLGNRVTVNLATNASGARTSTAAQVVAAINADPGASALLFARTYGGNAGGGVVQPRALVALSDFLEPRRNGAPEGDVQRGPHTVKMLRIGKHRDGSKVGVFIYAQEHAREWVPPQVTIETAERLLRNYAHDGATKRLVDNLDIFILPSVNPDGGTYSFYNSTGQRRSMTRHCALTATSGMPSSRNSWGVDNNRNYDEYSLFDGYSGGSSSCTSDTFSGPSELSEPENKNVDWVPTTYRNIKFSMNTHSSGNYFMWSPGAYITPGRILAPRPDLGTESYFWAASSHILTEIKKHRNTAVTPARTGPVADVLYSAAGNSGDMMFYKYGLIAWNFETGNAGFQPAWNSEGWNQTMEFANGMTGLLQVAHAWATDKKRPESKVVSEAAGNGTYRVKFTTSEPATVFYTLNGSRPGPTSPKYAASGDREPPETLVVPAGTTVHFYSVDLAGNVENNYNSGSGAQNFNKVRVG